jgi:transcription termination/antitermination protein NusG
MDQTTETATTTETTTAVEGQERFRWYAVITQSGMEKKATAVLQERIKKMNLQHLFGRIVIPTQQVEKIDDKGKKKLVEQKMMPGYIFIHMEMTEPAFHCVKDTPKISNFIGATQHRMPPAVGDDEVDRIINRAAHVAKEIAARPKMSFEKGEKVRVVDGPFTNFVGDVDEVKNDKQKLKLLISVFGRATPVEIEFSKVEKVVEGQ